MSPQRSTYFCIDIECNGQVPGLYDMVSLGAVVLSENDAGVLQLGQSYYVEIQPQARGKVILVFHDQDAAHAGFSGSSSVKVLPFPAPRLSAYARPPCRRATARTIDSPTPVPRTRDCSAAGRR